MRSIAFGASVLLAAILLLLTLGAGQSLREQRSATLASPTPAPPSAKASATPSPTAVPNAPQVLGAHPKAGVVTFFDAGTYWRYEAGSGTLARLPRPSPPPDGAIYEERSPDGRRFARIDQDHTLTLVEPDGRTRRLVADLQVGSVRCGSVRWSPTGRLLAVGRLPLPGTTHPLPGASLGPWMFLPNELWLVDANSGRASLVYDEPNRHSPQYFPKLPVQVATWSPDDRYLGVWPGAGTSASAQADGLELVLIDTTSGQRVSLGHVRDASSLTWIAPRRLLYVAGGGREIWRNKVVRFWSPDTGARDVTRPGEVGASPSWDARARLLYFVRGPEGEYVPKEYFALRGVGDRHVAVYDEATRAIRDLPRSPGYAEEGVRVSADGDALLVLRRRAVSFESPREISGHLELWLFRADMTEGWPLVRLAGTSSGAGFGYYGYFGFGQIGWSR